MRLPWFGSRRSRPEGLLGVELSSQGVAIAHVVRDIGSTPELQLCDYREAPPGGQADALKSLIQEHRLSGLPVNVLLPQADYQIVLLESPEVPADELRAAMRWRVKDIITQPLDDMIIDTFPLPDDAYRGRTRMAYCVMLAKSRMQTIAQLVGAAGVQLSCIDIGEMAARNLGMRAGAAGINLALLQLRPSGGLICVQNGADVYMARRIEQGVTGRDADVSGITLEIQRSLDYFESQLGKGYIARMLLMPMADDGEAVHQALAAGLAVNLLRLSLAELFPGQPAALVDEALQARCIGAVGAALREELA